MVSLLFYYLVLPFLAAWAVLRFIKKYGRNEVPEDIARLYAEQPLEKKWFRVLRRDNQEARLLGDFETHDEAVELAYRRRQEAQVARETAAFFVLNDKGEALEEVDS